MEGPSAKIRRGRWRAERGWEVAVEPMTLEVIDLPRGRWLPGFMSESNAWRPVRYDRTLGR